MSRSGGNVLLYFFGGWEGVGFIHGSAQALLTSRELRRSYEMPGIKPSWPITLSTGFISFFNKMNTEKIKKNYLPKIMYIIHISLTPKQGVTLFQVSYLNIRARS